jgi:MFS family permease
MKRLLLGLFACLQLLLAGGPIFGWSALAVVLKRHGVYAWLCVNGELASCAEQELALGRVMTVASTVCLFMGLPSGVVLDRWGPRKMTALSLVVFTAGILAFAFSSQNLDLYVLGFALMGACSPGIVMSTMHVSSVWGPHSGMLLALMNGCYDSSTVVFTLFKAVDEALGSTVSLRAIFLTYLGAVVLPIALIGVLVWPDAPYPPPDAAPPAKSGAAQTTSTTTMTTTGSNSESGRPAFGSADFMALSAIKQMRHLQFVLLALFFSTSLVRLTYYITSVNPHLSALSIASSNSTSAADPYSGIFGYVLPLAIFCTPIAGVVVDRLGTDACLFATSMLALLHSLATLVSMLSVQVASFILFVLFRAFLFTSVTGFIGRYFGFGNFGTIFGSTTLLASLLSLLQFPLLQIGVTTSFTTPALVVLALTLVGGVFPVSRMYAAATRCSGVRGSSRSSDLGVPSQGGRTTVTTQSHTVASVSSDSDPGAAPMGHDGHEKEIQVAVVTTT